MRLLLTGGCNCGAVRYEVVERLVPASYCDCERCQRRSGAAASTQAHPAPSAFRIVSGWNRLRVWKTEDDHRPTSRSGRNAGVSRGGGLRSRSTK